MRRRVKKYFIPHVENEHKPYFFREHVMLGLLLSTLLLFVASWGLSQIAEKSDTVAAIYSSVLVDLTNENRTAHGRESLRVNPILTDVAVRKSVHMAENGYFAHTSPDGLSPWHWFREAGYEFVYAGENLAIDFSQSDEVAQAWMESPTHRDNVLSEYFTEIGIATARGTYRGRQTVFITQAFGQPAAQSHMFGFAEAEDVEGSQLEVVDVAEVGSQQSVLGAEHEFIEGDTTVVRNIAAVAGSPRNTSDGGVRRYTKWYERFLVNPSSLIQYFYVAIMLIVVTALLLFVGIEIRKQHPKNLAYGIALLGVTVALMFFNQSLMITEIIVI